LKENVIEIFYKELEEAMHAVDGQHEPEEMEEGHKFQEIEEGYKLEEREQGHKREEMQGHKREEVEVSEVLGVCTT